MSSQQFLDELLTYYTGDGDAREWMRRPNTVGDHTYATDARSLIIVPNDRLKTAYVCHEKVADFKKFLGDIKPVDPVVYSFNDLDTILNKVEKVYDSAPCDDCDGEGKCFHCGADCDTCRGSGEVIDVSLPKVFPKQESAIRISDILICPYYMDLLRKTLKALRSDTFTMGWKNSGQIMFSIGDIRILFAGLYAGAFDHKEYPVLDLNPIEIQ